MGFILLWALLEKVICFVYFSCNKKISEKVSKTNIIGKVHLSTFHIITIFSDIDFSFHGCLLVYIASILRDILGF